MLVVMPTMRIQTHAFPVPVIERDVSGGNIAVSTYVGLKLYVTLTPAGVDAVGAAGYEIKVEVDAAEVAAACRGRSSRCWRGT